MRKHLSIIVNALKSGRHIWFMLVAKGNGLDDYQKPRTKDLYKQRLTKTQKKIVLLRYKCVILPFRADYYSMKVSFMLP